MKTTNLLCLLTLLVMLFSQCNDGNEAPPYTYHLKLKFEDSSGKNLVNGLMNQENGYHGYHSFQVTDTYKLQVSSTDVSDKKEILYVEVENDQAEYLYFSYSTFDYVASTITWKLVCPHIFGDNEEHIITSYWKKEDHHEASCLKITCDDKDVQFTQKQGSSAYTVLIPLIGQGE